MVRQQVDIVEKWRDQGHVSIREVSVYLKRKDIFVHGLINVGILRHYSKNKTQAGIKPHEVSDFLYNVTLALDQYSHTGKQTCFDDTQWNYLIDNYFTIDYIEKVDDVLTDIFN